MKPLVSVLMPVYNAERYIKEAIDSVLNQTYSELELIIVDDCGTDRTLEIVESYRDSRIKVLSNDVNRGIAFARNRGLEACIGKYIAILDDDDICMPERLFKQVDYLEHHDIDVVGGESVWINEEGQVVRETIAMPCNSDYIKTAFLFENMYNNSEVMFRRNLIEKYSIRYQDGLLGMEDFKFWIDCSKVGKFSNLSELLLKRRMVSENTTTQILSTRLEERKEVFQSLQEYSLKKSGFELTTDEYSILHECIGEDRMTQMMPKERFSFLMTVFAKLVKQCRELDFASDIQFRKYMKERLKRCL